MSHRMTKATKWHVRPAKTRISLGIHPVWSESSLCAQWVGKDPDFLHADREDSDQTGRMPRLIWVFAGRTCHFVGFVMRQLKSQNFGHLNDWFDYPDILKDLNIFWFHHRVLSRKECIYTDPDQNAPWGAVWPGSTVWSGSTLFTQTYLSKFIGHLSHITRNPVFGVCDQLRLKPACIATDNLEPKYFGYSK